MILEDKLFIEQTSASGSSSSRKLKLSAEMDITPMIDITFLLLIFFMVASRLDVSKMLELPQAVHGTSVSTHQSTIISLADDGSGGAVVYLSDGKNEDRRLEGSATEQAAAIRGFVSEGLSNGWPNVVIKAEKGVHHREVARVSAAAGEIDQVRLHFAVMDRS